MTIHLAEGTATLLVVDDQPSNLSILFHTLNAAGYQVLIAKNGQSALEKLNYVHPDLILLDVMMPVLDGFSTCQKIKAQEDKRDIPIIFMTALTETQYKLRGFEVGAADYVTKPIQSQELLARVKTHLHLYHLQKQLQIQNEELGTFAHTLAHDLKNPLNMLLLYAETLIEEYPIGRAVDEFAQRSLRKMARTSRRMFDLINEVLLLACASEQTELPLETLDMRELVAHLQEQELQPLLTKTAGQIELSGTDWPLVKGYRPWLEAVWLNYLSNGLKYGGHPPRLQLSARLDAQGEQVCFSISDNGSGIALEAQQNLFIPFHRLPGQKKAEGHGLGLSIIQRIVTRLGGKVGVDSAPGRGSRFYFTLPLADGE